MRHRSGLVANERDDLGIESGFDHAVSPRRSRVAEVSEVGHRFKLHELPVLGSDIGSSQRETGASRYATRLARTFGR
jgi:hypothetical protein